jgi:branched-chain amino acid transport system permease protein
VTVNLGGKDFSLPDAEAFCRRYANSFYYLSGLWLIYTIAMAAGLDVAPALGVVQVMQELAGEPLRTPMSCAVALAAIALFAFFGWHARQIERWPFVAGGWLFAADSLAPLIFLRYHDDLLLGAHALWLLVLSVGGTAVRRIEEARRRAAGRSSNDGAPAEKRPGVLRMIAVAALLAVLALLPVYVAATGQLLLLTLFTRIFIFALAAMSLNLILGYGGMASAGHTTYLGIGGYAVGILAAEGVTSGLVQWPLAIGASALFALAVGALSLRTRGIFFIMITYFFAQTAYFAAVVDGKYGGDDGLTIYQRSQFGGAIDLSDKFQFYYLCLALLAAAIFIVSRLVNSRFGMAIKGARPDERRMGATGFPAFRHRLAAFVIAGMMGGLAGALLINQTGFVSPAAMHWQRAGYLVVMVVLGGMGALFGPLLGAATLVMLEERVSSQVMNYWPTIAAVLLPFAVIHVLEQLQIAKISILLYKYAQPMKLDRVAAKRSFH